ncbi:unnamed protein product [Clavelina lepadiformis]|uniref:Uncharacterized protein n=1 Tax=Clavelina lepadiformis TaxID=159417 RepID=A0ABP0FRI5_CLALP
MFVSMFHLMFFDGLQVKRKQRIIYICKLQYKYQFTRLESAVVLDEKSTNFGVMACTEASNQCLFIINQQEYKKFGVHVNESCACWCHSFHCMANGQIIYL